MEIQWVFRRLLERGKHNQESGNFQLKEEKVKEFELFSHISNLSFSLILFLQSLLRTLQTIRKSSKVECRNWWKPRKVTWLDWKLFIMWVFFSLRSTYLILNDCWKYHTAFFRSSSSLPSSSCKRYAVPLRQLARDRDTAIIPLYEAQRLFGNVGEVLGANQAFLKELEALLKQGVDECKRRIGDVVYKHVSVLGKRELR